MKKIITLILVMVMACVLLAGCGNENWGIGNYNFTLCRLGRCSRLTILFQCNNNQSILNIKGQKADLDGKEEGQGVGECRKERHQDKVQDRISLLGFHTSAFVLHGFSLE